MNDVSRMDIFKPTGNARYLGAHIMNSTRWQTKEGGHTVLIISQFLWALIYPTTDPFSAHAETIEGNPFSNMKPSNWTIFS